MAVSESWWGGPCNALSDDLISFHLHQPTPWYGMVWYGMAPANTPLYQDPWLEFNLNLTFGFLSHLIVYQSHQEFDLGVVFLTSSSCVFCLLALIDWIWILFSKGASVAFPLKRIRTIESAFCQDSQHHTFHFLCFSKSIWASKVHFKINQS